MKQKETQNNSTTLQQREVPSHKWKNLRSERNIFKQRFIHSLAVHYLNKLPPVLRIQTNTWNGYQAHRIHRKFMISFSSDAPWEYVKQITLWLLHSTISACQKILMEEIYSAWLVGCSSNSSYVHVQVHFPFSIFRFRILFQVILLSSQFSRWSKHAFWL